DSETPDGDGRIVLSLAVEGGPVRIAAREADRDLEGTSAALFERPLGAGGHYFGGIHFHTRYSHDGDRDVRAAYRHARDYRNLDVVAVTDHTPGSDAWERTVRVNEAYDDPGAFATIPAWEWSAVEGHANVYLRSPAADAGPAVADPMEEPSYGHFETDYGDDPTVHPTDVDWPADALLVPHHTGAGDGDPWGPWDWERENDRITAVEIVQRRGNFEADEPDDDWGIQFGDHGASVRDALDAGYRLGFVAGTDNHQGFPTVTPDGPTGLTCFAADARTREAVWDAMNERRTYATSGAPILCRFAVDGHPFGAAAALAGEPVRFSAELYGTAPIERVEVVSDGETVWERDPGERDVVVEDEPLPAPDGESAYYYLRLRQADGHRAWVSPVWLDR
ncbi:MAG: CehA/McbA family metallohydrolase, partial [Halobacteriaceae archaeon]